MLWIIGADEGSLTTPGASSEDAASWWDQVIRWFDELAPDVVFLNVPTGSVTVVALLLSSDRVPLVVKSVGGGSPEREVPWRAGPAIRSAKRSDLIRILVPAMKLPTVEVVEAGLWMHPPRGEREPADFRYEVSFNVELYLEPTTDGLLVLPQHRATLALVGYDGDEYFRASPRLDPGGIPGSVFQPRPSIAETISRGANQLIVQGPASFDSRERSDKRSRGHSGQTRTPSTS